MIAKEALVSWLIYQNQRSSIFSNNCPDPHKETLKQTIGTEAGRKVLQMGCIRRIGDVSTTNIWRDQWLPGGVGMRPLCRKEGAVAEYVRELLSSDGLS